MRTVIISGADTGIGKTRVTAALARTLAADGASVQIVKLVESGTRDSAHPGDAEHAAALAGLPASAAYTVRRYAAAINPLDAAAAEGGSLEWAGLLADYGRLPECDWRLVEGAGGLGVPLDASGRDWTDFARAVAADSVVLVVSDRLGAINQSRMVWDYARSRGLHAGIWLNEADGPPPAEVARSTRTTLSRLGVPIWGELAHGALNPTRFDCAVLTSVKPQALPTTKAQSARLPLTGLLAQRINAVLQERDAAGLRRTLRVFTPDAGTLNLADNDYLSLARDPAIASAVARAAVDYGTSASGSPLITGWHAPHARLVETLCAWHGLPHGLLWSSGYAANAAILSVLPEKGDLVLADRLIHHSMVAGLLRSGARFKRYPHLDLDALEAELAQAEPGRAVFVVTESVFSMDGDYPDLVRMAELKRQFGFFWIVDEAHALGWYGPQGAGLVRAAALEADVDVLVGTCGKALASGGAYALFNDACVRDVLINLAGEFIYSTGLPPTTVAASEAAVRRMQVLATEQSAWRAQSRAFRAALRAEGWDALEGDSPIVPIKVGAPEAAVGLAAALREAGIIVAAVRPPTVPVGTSRLRLSLKRTFGEADAARVLAVLRTWKARASV